MNTDSFKRKMHLVGLTLLMLACQSVTTLANSATPEPLPRVQLGATPLSTFIAPAGGTVRIGVGEPLILQSYHLSRDKLAKLEIFVNDQLVRTEDSSAQVATFSPDLALVQVVVDDRDVKPLTLNPSVAVVLDDTVIKAVTVNPIEPEFLTSAWTVSLLWTGRVPGTYKLSLRATDRAGRTGKPAVLDIEVR